MTKLSDTQLIVLSSAAKHDEGLATRPANLNAAAATKVAPSLIDKGLARMRGFHTAPRVPRDLDKMPPLAHGQRILRSLLTAERCTECIRDRGNYVSPRWFKR